MSVTSRRVEQQRERTPPVRLAFSATGLQAVAYDRTVSPNSLRCDEEVARISADVASPPRPRTSLAPDSPSRCYVNMPVGEPQRRSPPPAFGVWPHVLSHMSSRAQSRAPSQMSGLDVAGLPNRLVDRQHDDLRRAEQREQSVRAEAKAKAARREQQLKTEASEREKQAEQREQRAVQREREVKAEAIQREKQARAEAKAEALRREKQIRSEVEHEARRAVRLREKELEVDRLRRKLAKKEDKERRPQLSSASHTVRAPTPTGVGLTEEELVAVLNREMERRRQEEEQRAVEARRIQQLETERLRCQSLESTGPCLEVPPTVVSVSSIDTGASGLWTHCLSRTESRLRIL